LPAKTRRRSTSGIEVRRESMVARFFIDKCWGTLMGNVSPEMSLTNICIVDRSSGDAEREMEDEERILKIKLAESGV